MDRPALEEIRWPLRRHWIRGNLDWALGSRHYAVDRERMKVVDKLELSGAGRRVAPERAPALMEFGTSGIRSYSATVPVLRASTLCVDGPARNRQIRRPYDFVVIRIAP